MTDAFKCDRCGAFDVGDPEEYQVYENTDDDRLNPTLAEPDLCEDCAEAFETAIEAFLINESPDLAGAVQRVWRKRERKCRRMGPGRGDGDD